MKMANQNTGNACRRCIGKDELPLRPLTWIKKKPFSAHPHKIGSMIAKPRWLLARGTKDDELLSAQSTLQEKKELLPKMAPISRPLR